MLCQNQLVQRVFQGGISTSRERNGLLSILSDLQKQGFVTLKPVSPVIYGEIRRTISSVPKAVSADVQAATDTDKTAPANTATLTDNSIVIPATEVLCCGMSTGEDMIACDNALCRNGIWFHYSCVGISAASIPDQWYCDKCRPQRNRRKKRKKLSVAD